MLVASIELVHEKCILWYSHVDKVYIEITVHLGQVKGAPFYCEILLCVCGCVCVCARSCVCVCVCVWERERNLLRACSMFNVNQHTGIYICSHWFNYVCTNITRMLWSFLFYLSGQTFCAEPCTILWVLILCVYLCLSAVTIQDAPVWSSHTGECWWFLVH